MKLKKFIKTIALVLCFSFLNSVISVGASGASAMPQGELSVQNVSVDSVSEQAKKQGEDYYVSLLFVFIHSEPSLFSSAGIVVYGQKVTVLSDSGFYTYVKTENGTKGYIFTIFLSKSLFKSKSLTVPKYACVFTGKTGYSKVVAEYDGSNKISWTVADKSILSFDQETGNITGLKPGVTKITARTGLLNYAECTVSVINEWKEAETATAQKKITVRRAPGDTYDALITIEKGTSITARGDMADGSGWIYVSTKSDKYWGFIKLSDFSAIDYLMTQYHYYDKGFNVRFGSASDKIYDYASVLNDVMMANFKLKVCPYVEAYISAADNCKTMSYNSIEGNLTKACPKTTGHGVIDEKSCTTTISLRNQLIADKDIGNNVVTKAVWTGHIMNGNNPSNSEPTSHTLVFTTANTVSYNSSTGSYTNKSKSNIRYYSLYEITHETGHQLGLIDGYCYRDNNNLHCTNDNCFKCNGKPIPDCIMAKIKSPEQDKTPFCSDCQEIIKNHLKNHH